MKAAQVVQAVRVLRQELLDLAQALVRLPTVTGEEDAAQHYLARVWREWGLDVDLWTPERDEVSGHPAFCDDGLPIERPNLVARWGEAGDEPAALILNGHIDVVPVGERSRWESDPFSGDVRQGNLFGRGACDMKGGLAAASVAVRAAQGLGIVPKRPILLQSVIGEETGGLGTLAAILRGYHAEAAVITEPTGLTLCPVQSGALSFRLTIPGRATHGATPQAGVSAIEKFWPVWQGMRELEARRHQNFRHPLYDPARLAAPLSVGKLSAGNWPSTVPDEAVAEGRYGVFPGEDCDVARRELEEAIVEASRGDAWLRENPVRVDWIEGQFEPGETETGSPILRDLGEAHRAVIGTEPRTLGVPYGSDLRLFTRHAKIPAVLYGPGDVQRAHAANECVPVEELLAAAQVLCMLLMEVTARS